MPRKTAADFDRELLDIYDRYAHGLIERREFLSQASKYAAAGVTAAMLLEALSPNYALADQVDPADPRIHAETVAYASPDGHGTVSGYLVRPAGGAKRGGNLRGCEARKPGVRAISGTGYRRHIEGGAISLKTGQNLRGFFTKFAKGVIIRAPPTTSEKAPVAKIKQGTRGRAFAGEIWCDATWRRDGAQESNNVAQVLLALWGGLWDCVDTGTTTGPDSG